MTSYETRPALPDDAGDLARLSSESFGYPPSGDAPRPPDAAGRRTWVTTFDGQVVAAATDRPYDSWFWGSRVSTSGIASVKVAAEHRGNALLSALFDRMLAAAVDRGAAVSTLFATAPGIYRRFGYETFGSYDEVAVPTAELGRVRTAGGSVRRATVTDAPAIRELYERWARAHNGPLARDGVSFPATDQEMLAEPASTTLALDDDGAPAGYAMWRRTGGYHADGLVEVDDLVALTEQAARRLLHSLGTSATVAPTTVISTSTPDIAQLVLPSHPWRVRQANPYGLAVLDVARALTTRAYPTWADHDLRFGVHGLAVNGQDGTYRLRVSEGTATVDRGDAAEIAFTARGLALRYAGTHSCEDLRRAGLLTGPRSDDDRWDAMFAGRQAHIRDYF